MTEKSEHRIKLENMKIGDVLKFSNDVSNKIRLAARSMYCHGKTLIVKKKKGEDFITVSRVE